MITIPNTAVPYILLQRTQLQRFNPLKYRVIRRLGIPYERTLMPLEARLRAGTIKAEFAASVEQDYAQIHTHLPHGASAILDIGCGVAGIDALLHRHYGDGVDYYLLDRSEVNPAAFRYGMGEADRFYTSLHTARDLLIANGGAASRIHLLEAAPGFQLDPALSFDLVISLISWGFHYPLETYLDQVERALKPQGVIILDVRQGDGEALLRQRFGRVERIATMGKQIRLAVQR